MTILSRQLAREPSPDVEQRASTVLDVAGLPKSCIGGIWIWPFRRTRPVLGDVDPQPAGVEVAAPVLAISHFVVDEDRFDRIVDPKHGEVPR